MLTLYVEACKVFSFRVRCDDRTVKYQTPTNITHLLPMTSDPQSHLGAWARGLYRAVVTVETASVQEHAGTGIGNPFLPFTFPVLSPHLNTAE
jgi:hypothetical protein